MLVPLDWIQEYVAAGADVQEIADRLTMGGLEVEGIAESEAGSVLDVYITPNRGDCLSMLGVAREIAALYDLPLNAPNPPASQPGGEAAAQTSVTIESPDLCPRYAARLLSGITIEPSPDWMQRRLLAAGQRPINNLVDVTNYVMLELGQPLHAFDLDTLAERRIVVRRAHAEETLQTLDGETRSLTPDMLVIADAEKAVAIAGVMGGAETEVTEKTVNLLLESAHFQPLSVRRTARALGMRTEASYRFERVVDPDGVCRALDRACQLLAAMGQPQALSGTVDVYPNPPAPKIVSLRASRAAALLGISDITPEVAEERLKRLGLDLQVEGDTLHVAIPGFRPDLNIEEDLIEEVGRIYG
jgi:phenylalanyl-tRNA synthetase beta chain